MNRVLTILTGALVAVNCVELRAEQSADANTKVPHIFYPEDYPKSSRDMVDAIMSSKRHTFVDSTEFPSFGSLRMLRFCGDTIALNHFMGDLSKCESVTIDILFRKPDNGHFLHGYDWVVHKPTGVNKFVIRVNLASLKLDLTLLTIPQIKTGKIKPPKVKSTVTE